jgi:hypothetical protein
VIATAILDRLLHHAIYRLKDKLDEAELRRPQRNNADEKPLTHRASGALAEPG